LHTWQAENLCAGHFSLPWVMGADQVAEICFSGLMQGKRIIIPGLMNKILAFSTRFAPRSVSASIAQFLNRP
jgi:short-subunit dehydrogenase